MSLLAQSYFTFNSKNLNNFKHETELTTGFFNTSWFFQNIEDECKKKRKDYKNVSTFQILHWSLK